MARWRSQEPPRIEPPSWYRRFDPAAWDEPDGQEQRMINGNLGRPWGAEIHEIHARRRWGEAKHEYRKAHPALAEQELNDLIEGERRSRMSEIRRDPPGA